LVASTTRYTTTIIITIYIIIIIIIYYILLTLLVIDFLCYCWLSMAARFVPIASSNFLIHEKKKWEEEGLEEEKRK